MKKLLVIIPLLFYSLICYSFETTTTQFPQAQMQSVNNFNSGVSHEYNITPVGAYSPSQTITPNSSQLHNGIKRSKEFPEDPYQTPIGDVPVILFIILIGLYIGYKKMEEN